MALKKKTVTPIAWDDFNKALMAGDEQNAAAMLKAEQRGPNRTTFILRAYSRLNRLRARRERAKLGAG